MKLKIALLQLYGENDRNKQLEKGINACKKAKEMGADIALFPKCGATVIISLRIQNF